MIWNAFCAYSVYVITQSRRTVYTSICRLYVAAVRYRSLSLLLDMPSLLSPFCSNDSRTLSALRATVRERFKADAILIRKSSDSQNTSGKGRGSEGSEKKWGTSGPSHPLPRLRRPRRLHREGQVSVKCSTLSTKSCGDRRHCIKTPTFANVFYHHCSSPDIYRSRQKWVKAVI